MEDDDIQPVPGVHILQSGDAVAVFLAPGVEEDSFTREQLSAYFSGVTFHFVHGVVGVAVKPR